MLNAKLRILLGLFCALLITGSAPTASAQTCPSGARPGSICGSGTGLPDGASACVGAFFSNGTSVEINGQATGAAPRWTIWQYKMDPNIYTDPNQNPGTKIFKTTALGVTADIINNSTINDPLTGQPESTYFPGYFQACVFNYETGVPINYLISIGPGQY
jgi:hypothetical protein